MSTVKLERTVEVREAFITPEEGGKMILEGYAAVFEQPTLIYERGGGHYTEIIDRGAFENCDMSKCCLKYNHDRTGLVMARTRGGSLIVAPDEHGLKFRAELFNTQTSRDCYEVVRSGGIDGCSFSFVVDTEGEWNTYDKGVRVRRITKIARLLDVSLVDIPAYDGTSVEARSFFEAEAEKELADAEKRAKAVAVALARIEIYKHKNERMVRTDGTN